MSFGKRFKDLRNKLGLTQEELRIDFNKKYHRSFTAAAISMYENDKRIPEIDALKDFSNFFNVSIDYLLGESDVENPREEDNNSLPKEFNSPEEAMKFILEQPTLMDYGGYSLDEMNEDEILDLANDLLFAMKLALEKRKNK